MRHLNLILLLVIFSYVVYSDIDIKGLEDSYTFGESINISVTVDYDDEVDGFIKLTLDCEKKTTDFFEVNLPIIEGKKATAIVPPLRILEERADPEDECNIRAYYLNEEKEEILRETSDEFDVTSEFEVFVSLNKKEFSPGEKLIADIEIDVPDDAFSEVTVDLVIDKKLSRYDSDEPSFSITYELPDNIQSGSQNAVFQIEDMYGNSEEEEITILIISKPSRIDNLHLKGSYDAQKNENLSFKPVLFDQSGKSVDYKVINVDIVDTMEEVVYSDSILSTREFNYEIPDNIKPGQYSVVSTYEDLEKKSFLTIVNVGYQEELQADTTSADSDQGGESTETGELSDTSVESESAEGLGDITGLAIKEATSKESTNFYKYLTGILVLLIVIYAVFMYGKHSGSKKKNIFKKDEFKRKEIKKDHISKK